MSTFSISAFAVAGIVLSAIPMAVCGDVASDQVDVFSLTGMTIGISVLVISLLEAGNGYALAAVRLHDNARLMTELQDKLALALAAGGVDEAKLRDISDEYDRLKRECPDNHAPIDHQKFRAERRTAPEFASENGRPTMGRMRALYCTALWYLQPAWVAIVAWVLAGASIGGVLAF